MRKRDYPKIMFIGLELWRLYWFRKIPKGEDKKTVGLCDPSDKTIHVKYGQSDYETLRTYIHEVIHAIQDEYNIKFHKNPTKDHEIVEKLEIAITHFIWVNFLVNNTTCDMDAE